MSDPYNYTYDQPQPLYQVPPTSDFPANPNSPSYNNHYNGFDDVSMAPNNAQNFQNEYIVDPAQQQQQNPFDDTSSVDPTSTTYYNDNNNITNTAEPPIPTHLTPEQVIRKKFAWSSVGLLLLSILLVTGCILSTVIKALDLNGVKSIISLVISSLLNIAVIVVSLLGIVASLLNKKGWENMRYRLSLYNLIGLLSLCAIETIYLILTNIFIPLLGIAMFFIGMIFVVLFYVPCIAISVYRIYLMKSIPGAIPEDVKISISSSVSSVMKAGMSRIMMSSAAQSQSSSQ